MKLILCTLLTLLYYSISAQSPQLMLPVGHTRQVNKVAISKNGKLVATVSDDATAKVWELGTKRLLFTFYGHTAEVDLVAFNNAGTKLVTGSKDGTARVWDLTTGKQQFSFSHTAAVSNVSFSPDDNYLLTAAWREMKANILAMKNGNLLLECMQTTDSTDDRSWTVFQKDKTKIFAAPFDLVGFDEDSQSVFLVSYKGIMKWSLPAAKPSTLIPFTNDGFRNLDISIDGKLIVSTNGEDKIRIWNTGTNDYRELFAPGKKFTSASLSPDSKTLLTGASDGAVQLWDCATGGIIQFLEGHRNEVIHVLFLDNDHFLSEARGEPLKWYDRKGVVIGRVNGSNASASADGKFFAVAGYNWLSMIRTDGSAGPQDFLAKGLRPVAGFFTSDLSFGCINYEEAGYVLADLSGNDFQVKRQEGSIAGIALGISKDEKLVFIKRASKVQAIGRKDGKEKWAIDSVDQFVLSSDRKYFSILKRGFFSLWDAVSLRQLTAFSKNAYISHTSFSPTNQWLLFSRDSFFVHDPGTGLLKAAIKAKGNIRFAPGNKTFFSTSLFSSALGVYTFPDGKPYKLLEAPGIIQSAELSSDGQKIVTTSWNGVAAVWTYPECKFLFNLGNQDMQFTGARFSPDNKYIITAVKDKLLRVWNAATGALSYSLPGHAGNILDAHFSLDGKRIMTLTDDLAVGIWQAKPGGNAVFIYNINGEIVRMNKHSFYFGPADAVRVFYYRKGLNTIGIQQLDVKYNRPDIVLKDLHEVVKMNDTLLIPSYRKAWEKRIKKLGIDTSSFKTGYSIPEADFVNRSAISFEQKSSTLQLHIRGIDSSFTMDRFNIWINECPLFGQRGISIRNRNSKHFDTTVTIRLSQGKNQVETSITNVNGTESYRMPVTVNYIPATKQKESLRFIGIGIDRFAYPGKDLQYSTKDIRDLAEKLKEKYKDDIIIDTLFNKDVTLGNVKALKQKLLQTTENDKVIISYSGHGLLSKDFDYFLSTYTMNFGKPEENGLPYEELENLLDSIPARRKLMLIDACHSGEVDKDEITRYEAAKDSLRKQGTKGGGTRYTGETTVGMKNSFELMQSLFVNVGKSTGATIISAAAGTQFALERGDLKNGVFTYSILEAMNKYPTMKISELKKIVGERVEQLTNGLQKPTSRNEAIATDWNIW